MRLTLRLLIAQWRRHWLRTLIVACALAASVGMVVSVSGSQQVMMARMRAAAGRPVNPLGRFQVLVRPGTPQEVEADRRRSGVMPPAAPFDEAVLRWLRASPDVRERAESCQFTGESVGAGPMFTGPMYRPGDTVSCAVIGSESDHPPMELAEGEWLGGRGEAAVVSSGVARRLGGRIGGTFQLATPTGRHEVRIEGILEEPQSGGMGMMGGGTGTSGIYVAPAFWEKLSGKPLGVNHILLALKEGVSEETFGGALERAARDGNQPITLQTAADFQAESARFASMFGGGGGGPGFFPLLNNAGMNLAVLAALFIVFNAFSMGVSERSRQLAMLRAAGATRGGIVRLIGVEALALAVVGWLAGEGLGYWLLQRTLSQPPGRMGPGMMMPGAPTESIPVDIGFLMKVGAFTAFGAVLLAAALPTLLASRKRPGEVMSLPLANDRPRLAWWLAAAGLPLIAACPVLCLWPVFSDGVTGRLVMPASILGAMIGFVLVMPLAIRVCGGVFGRVAGFVLRLDHRLLSGTLRANLWRTVGSSAALLVGLGVFLVVQIWGQSMLSAFLVAPRSPDAIAVVFPDGVPADRLSAVAALGGVTKAFPMVLQHPELADLSPDMRVEGIFSRDVVYLGCDPEGLLGEDGMIEAAFVRGEAKEAYAKVRAGGHCLITDSLYLRVPDQYDVGRTLTLRTVESPHRAMTYTIAGVVQMPGWHLLTKSARMRRGLGRVGGIVIVSEGDAALAYPGSQYGSVWFRLAEGTDPASLEAPIIKVVDPNARPMRATSRPTSRPGSRPTSRPGGFGPGGGGPGSGMGPRGGMGGGPGGMGMGPRGGGPGGPGGRFGDPNGVVMMDSPVYCRLTNTRAMTAAIQTRAGGIIEALTVYPLLALGLAALAVASTVLASVRSRSWEIGILRGMGLTRGQLLRQVLAEGLLIGLLASVMSLAFGLLASWAGIAATSRTWGVSAPFSIPWARLGLGIGAAVAACMLASVWPALVASLRQPIRLLQSGRATD